MTDSQSPLNFAILGLLVSSLIITYRRGWLKKINLYYDNIDSQGILLDSALFITSPFLTVFIARYISNRDVFEIFKGLIPLSTFILGQFIERRKKDLDTDNRVKVLLTALNRELKLIQDFLSTFLQKTKDELNRLRQNAPTVRIDGFSSDSAIEINSLNIFLGSLESLTLSSQSAKLEDLILIASRIRLKIQRINKLIEDRNREIFRYYDSYSSKRDMGALLAVSSQIVEIKKELVELLENTIKELCELTVQSPTL